VENTNKRSISAPQKPRKKNLIQKIGLSRKTLTVLPRKINPTHIRIEKRERAEQRLKLKIGSLFIKVQLIAKSDNKVTKKKNPPNIKLMVSP